MEALDDETTRSLKSKSSANGHITNISQDAVSERSTSTVSPKKSVRARSPISNSWKAFERKHPVCSFAFQRNADSRIHSKRSFPFLTERNKLWLWQIIELASAQFAGIDWNEMYAETYLRRRYGHRWCKNSCQFIYFPSLIANSTIFFFY